MAQFILMSKRAQVWSLDLIIAGVIFLLGIIILYYYAINYSTQTQTQLNEMFYEGNHASELILDEENFGILVEGKINQTKLEVFDSLSNSDKKSLLGIKNNFYFIIEDLEIDGVFVPYIGIMNSSEVENLIQVTRLTIYKNKPTKFQIFIWT